MANPGWSERQYKKAKQSIDQWPQWMRANLNVRQAVEEEKRALARLIYSRIRKEAKR